ncbi:unnamed protein product [Withania somnifera]
MGRKKFTFLNVVDIFPSKPSISTRKILPFESSYSSLLRCTALHRRHSRIVPYASNVGAGSGSFEESQGNKSHNVSVNQPSTVGSSKIEALPSQIPYPLSITLVLCGCSLVFSLIAFTKRGLSSLIAAFTKSGFTAAFSLIFVSEIGDKTFFIAALLAMQYKRILVLLGSMGALSLMTVFSVIIGRIFHPVPAQFQTTLPIGEYAAVALLFFFGLNSIKDAWELPSYDVETGGEKDQWLFQASNRLTNLLEILWKSFSLVFFAEWGDRSMLATIALGAAQSPWGMASGAIAGHLVATSLAIIGGALLANYISEKLVGYLGGVLFLVFAVATLFGVF